MGDEQPCKTTLRLDYTPDKMTLRLDYTPDKMTEMIYLQRLFVACVVFCGCGLCPAIALPAETFWSFQALQPVSAPRVIDSSWPRSRIDRFVLARLEKEGLAPVPGASRRTLIRRVTFDLLGLPPAPA